MTADKARDIFDKNALCQEGSLRQSLCVELCFSERRFWEFYDSVITLAEAAQESRITVTDTAKLFAVYDRILETIRQHCDPDEAVEISGLPENITEYLDRIEAAMRFYLEGEPVDEDGFSLKRP